MRGRLYDCGERFDGGKHQKAGAACRATSRSALTVGR
jgi:hypothetical protein